MIGRGALMLLAVTGCGALARERAVAELSDLVAWGRTNREVSGQLFLFERTVEGHLARVFGKLGLMSRANVAEIIGRARVRF